MLYLQHIGKKTRFKSAAKETCNALAWAHSNAGLISLISTPFFKATLEGLQRSLAKLVVKKEPVNVDMLKAISKDAEESRTLSGFLRSNEQLSLRPCDCYLEDGVL